MRGEWMEGGVSYVGVAVVAFLLKSRGWRG